MKRSFRLLLIALIMIGVWYEFGDQLTFKIQALTSVPNCRSFSSTVAILEEVDEGTIYSNGVLVSDDTILTVAHAGVDTTYIIYANGVLYRDRILKVDTDPKLDLAVLTIKPISGMKPARTSDELVGPFTLSTLRDYETKKLYAGSGFGLEDTFIVFENQASVNGDSGAPLLNASCEVVAIVHGGDHRLVNGHPTSKYIRLP